MGISGKKPSGIVCSLCDEDIPINTGANVNGKDYCDECFKKRRLCNHQPYSIKRVRFNGTELELLSFGVIGGQYPNGKKITLGPATLSNVQQRDSKEWQMIDKDVTWYIPDELIQKKDIKAIIQYIGSGYNRWDGWIV